MSEPQLKIVPSLSENARDAGQEWTSSQHEAVVGKDILELLSSSMYVDPMSVYREYVQNAADSIDEARSQGLLESTDGRVSIHVDANTRTIRIRDDGTSIPWADFVPRLSNLGASRKRGTPARGFRGVGRLSGLGYCQELIFRGRTDDEFLVSELRWDGRALKTMLRNAGHDKNLKTLVNEIISVRRVPANDYPKRFFEIEMRGVIRHRDDRLLSPRSVADYLAQVAPVPFFPDFKYGAEISSALGQFVRLGNLAIHIDDSEVPLYRPHQNVIKVDGETEAKFNEMEMVEIHGIDGGISAFGWILHHEYAGALSSRALVKGIRLRSGNVQVGDNNLVEALFAEPRFNSWAVGEIHIVDPKVLPNGRRDNFEHSVHLDNVINQIGPAAREITRRCRQNSIARKLERVFEIHRDAALERAKAVSRGGITKASRQLHADAAYNSLKAMRRVLQGRNLDEDVKTSLAQKADTIESRVKTLIGEKAEARDPLSMFSGAQRAAYQKIISLIYECSTNKIVAGLLVEKLLVKLTVESKSKAAQSKRSSRPGAKRSLLKRKSK
jgi:molecular chaperone HtpG